jgi:hypothetical protein
MTAYASINNNFATVSANLKTKEDAALASTTEKTLITNLQAVAVVTGAAQFWTNWDAATTGTKAMLATVPTAPLDTVGVGNAVNAVLLQAVKVAPVERYAELRALISKMQSMTAYASIDNNFATVSANLKIKEDTPVIPDTRAIENTLIKNLKTASNFSILTKYITNALATTPIDKTALGAALIAALNKAVGLATSTSQRATMSTLVTQATDKKTTHFTPSQQTTLRKIQETAYANELSAAKTFAELVNALSNALKITTRPTTTVFTPSKVITAFNKAYGLITKKADCDQLQALVKTAQESALHKTIYRNQLAELAKNLTKKQKNYLVQTNRRISVALSECAIVNLYQEVQPNEAILKNVIFA